MKWQLEPSADVKRFKEVLDCGEVVRATVTIPDSYREMVDAMHHASLKNIFQKLVVRDRAASLNFKHPSSTLCVRIGVEAFHYSSPSSKQNWHEDFVFNGFATLNAEAKLLQVGSKPRHDGIAALPLDLNRIDLADVIFK